MSENRSVNAAFEQLFNSNDLQDDAGVISFGKHIEEFEQELKQRYIEGGRANIPADDLREAEEEMRERWPFIEKVALIAGRIEIASDSEDDTIAAILGEVVITGEDGTVIHEDEETGYRYCYVYNARFESSHIVVDTIYDDDGKLNDIRVYYEFKIPLDDDGDILFYARPRDLTRHIYEGEVSPTEAGVRLRHKWPKQFAILESLTLDSTDPLPVRLTAIADTLCDELQDADFRKYVELYVNDELALNQELPYSIIVHNEVDVLGDADDSSWLPLIVTDTLVLDLYRPDIRFTRAGANDPTVIEACIYGETFNDADGDAPELVTIPAQNLEAFRSTWARDSLASIALGVAQYEARTDVPSKPDVTLAATLLPESGEEVSQQGEELSYIEQLEMIEDLFATIQRHVVAVESETYITHEAASVRSYKLTETLISMLNGTIFRSGVEVEIAGDVLRTNTVVGESQGEDSARETFWYKPDAENPVGQTEFGEYLRGIIDPVVPIRPFVKSTEDEDTGMMVYWPAPRLAVRLPDRSTGEVILGGMLFSRITAEGWAAVSLAGDAEMKIVRLEQFRTQQEALRELKQIYGEDSPLVRRLLAIEEDLRNEDERTFVPLRPSRLAGLPDELISSVGHMKKVDSYHATAPVLAALEMMFNKKSIKCQSDVFKKDTDGFVIDNEYEGEQEWTVIDFKLSDDMHEIVMFVGHAEEPEIGRYIPLSSIKSFAF